MTGGALAVGDRLMLGLRALLSGDGVGMTLSANLQHGRFQQRALGRGMRRMTVDAPFLVDQRPVQFVLVKSVVHHVVMAPLAELVTVLERCERFGRRRVGMTLFAHALFERFMHVVIQHGLGVGAVRVVTGSAVGSRITSYNVCYTKLLRVKSRNTGASGTLT